VWRVKKTESSALEVLGNNRRQSAAKPAGVRAISQRLTPAGRRSGLLTRIAATESVSLCTRDESRRKRCIQLAKVASDHGANTINYQISNQGTLRVQFLRVEDYILQSAGRRQPNLK
jgi:hypothetical protein